MLSYQIYILYVVGYRTEAGLLGKGTGKSTKGITEYTLDCEKCIA